jgi:hypothetical protein
MEFKAPPIDRAVRELFWRQNAAAVVPWSGFWQNPHPCPDEAKWFAAWRYYPAEDQEFTSELFRQRMTDSIQNHHPNGQKENTPYTTMIGCEVLDPTDPFGDKPKTTYYETTDQRKGVEIWTPVPTPDSRYWQQKNVEDTPKPGGRPIYVPCSASDSKGPCQPEKK